MCITNTIQMHTCTFVNKKLLSTQCTIKLSHKVVIANLFKFYVANI